MSEVKEIRDTRLTPDQKLLAEAKERYKTCVESSTEIRKDMLIDLQFVDGAQWDSQIQQSRQQAKRPSLTINKLRVYINQVINDIRANRPSVKVRPTTDGVPESTAKVQNGLIKHILNNGDFKSAVDNAVKYAVSCGCGYFRLLTEYRNESAFDQEFRVKSIDNPFLVYFPLNLVHETDFSDSPYAFIRMSMSKDAFREKYPNADDMSHWASESVGDQDWTEKDDVWLAEYFRIEEEPVTLYLLADGRVVDVVPPELELLILKKRDSVRKKVMWYLLSEHTVIDREELVFRTIPIVPVMGQDFVVDNKKRFYSLIRDAIDPQRLYNFWKSCEAEILMLTPKAVWMGAKGAFDGLENQYKEANAKPIAFLEYNPSTNLAIPTAPPQRIEQPQISTAFISAAQGSNDDIRATTGLFQQSMGQGGAEKSGKAITALQRQGDTANYHFFESVNVAIRRLGRLLIDGIPRIYDTKRTIRILGEDNVEDVVKINEFYHDEKRGLDVMYDLTAGEYDVVVDTTIAYETRRLEALDVLTRFISTFPPAAQVIGDILARNLDIPEAREMGDRLRRMIPPEILEDPNADGGIDEAQVRSIVGDLQKLQQQLQMSEMQKQQLQQIIGQLTAELKSKEAETQVKADTAVLRHDSEIQKAQMGLQKEQVKHHADMQKNIVRNAIDLHRTRQDVAAPAEETYGASPTALV